MLRDKSPPSSVSTWEERMNRENARPPPTRSPFLAEGAGPGFQKRSGLFKWGRARTKPTPTPLSRGLLSGHKGQEQGTRQRAALCPSFLHTALSSFWFSLRPSKGFPGKRLLPLAKFYNLASTVHSGDRVLIELG